jgi:hypothetical protein
VRQLNDEPTLVDRLNRHRLVREVGDTIATCQPPQVFAVHGDWGMGKTSFLHQVQLYLSGGCAQQSDKHQEEACALYGERNVGRYEDRVVVIWFEAWRYEHEKAPVVALLHEMRSQLAWYVKLRQEAGKLAHVAVRGALLSLEDLTKKIGFQASKIEQAGREWEEQHLAVSLPSHTIREHLQHAIGLLLPDRSRRRYDSRLVVLIDDLDRCDPEAAYRLLEGLKIYLTLPNCVFVLGMNQRIVEDGISRALKVEEPGRRSERASAYLEKLCQNVWRLPSVEQPNDLLLEWLPEGPLRESLRVALGSRPCLPRNPRRIKGLANLLQRLATRLSNPGGPPNEPARIREAQLLLVVAYVHQFHHELFRRWESDPKLYKFILDRVRGFPPTLEFLQALQLPYAITADEQAPTPRWNVAEAFPDPEERSVFWIQPLIHELGEVKESDFARYLHG